MKKPIALVIALALALCAGVALAGRVLPAEGILRVNAQLRKRPSTEAESLMILMKGQTVTVLEIVSGWAHVQYGRVLGYIRSDLFENTTIEQAEGVASAQPQRITEEEDPKDTLGIGVDSMLKPGMRGDAVKRLQEALIFVGYPEIVADGIYGDLTRDVVRAFQRENGLKTDGIFGGETLEKLLAAIALILAAEASHG